MISEIAHEVAVVKSGAFEDRELPQIDYSVDCMADDYRQQTVFVQIIYIQQTKITTRRLRFPKQI